MSLFNTDPLLAICRLLVWLTLGFLAIGFLGLAGGIGAVWVMHDQVIAEVMRSYPDMEPAGVMPVATILMLLAVGAIALFGWFMLCLNAIIGSVPAGEAFSLANARRLRTMAWISFAGMVVGSLAAIPGNILQNRLGERIADGANLQFHSELGGFDLGQLILTLVLFVLARLFAQAAAMRQEIEETV